jgi:hypothetical protein
MAWIYRDKNGDLMFSKVKPEKVYIFRFKNCEIHKESESTWSPFLDYNHIITARIPESYFETPGYYEVNDYGDDNVLRKVYKNECVFEGDYSMGFPVKFKPETISALKPVVDLENLTIEDGLIEI